MEVYVFVRFYAHPGREGAVGAMLREMVVLTRTEPGCLGVNAYRSVSDPRLFWVHSRWTGKEALEMHATVPHMVRFLEKIQELTVDQLDVASTHLIV